MKKSSRTKPVILCAALTGARYSPLSTDYARHAEYLPLTVEATVADARAAYDAGARILHIHARNPQSGEQWCNTRWYIEVAAGVRRNCPMAILSYPTSRQGEVSDEIEDKVREAVERGDEAVMARARAEMIRANGLEALPDTITVFTASEVLLGDTNLQRKERPGWRNPEVVAQYYKLLTTRINDLGIGQDIEITSNVCLRGLEYIAGHAELGIGGTANFVILLGYSSGLPVDEVVCTNTIAAIKTLCRRFNISALITVGAVIRPWESAPSTAARIFGTDLPAGKHDYREVLNWLLKDDVVDIFRVGLEDTPLMYGRQCTNAELVREAAIICLEQGVRIETDVSHVHKFLCNRSN